MGEKYSVIFTGEIIDGLDIDLVKSNLSDKLKISNKKIDSLFKKAPRVLKRYERFEKAVRLVAVLKSCGAVAEIAGKKNRKVSPERLIDTKKESFLKRTYQKARERKEEKKKNRKKNITLPDVASIITGALILGVIILGVVIWVALGNLFGETENTSTYYPNSIEEAAEMANGFFGNRDGELLFGFEFDGKGNYKMYGANKADNDWGQAKDPGKYTIKTDKTSGTGRRYYYIKLDNSYRPPITIDTRNSFTYGEHVLYRDSYPFSK